MADSEGLETIDSSSSSNKLHNPSTSSSTTSILSTILIKLDKDISFKSKLHEEKRKKAIVPGEVGLISVISNEVIHIDYIHNI